jgi:hypothetical protein
MSINRELDDFAMTVYGAYSSFRIAGFEEDKAFALATTFMVTAMNKQVPTVPAKTDD